MPTPQGLDWAKLQRYKLFQDLTEDELRRFLDGSRVLNYPGEIPVLKQGEAAHGLGIILRGKVKITRRDDHGGQHFLSVLKEGDFFGEMALLDAGVRSATVETLEDTQVMWISAEEFRSFVASASPLIAKVLARMVADLSYRLRLLDDRYVFVKTHFGASRPGI